MRLHAQTAVIENVFVWPPDAAPWLADYVPELTAFPAGRHDDQVDSACMRRGLGEGEAPWDDCGGLGPIHPQGLAVG